MSVFTQQDLAAIAWSYAMLGLLDEPLFAALSAAARDSLHEFAARSLGNIAWSLATLLCKDVPLLPSIAEAAPEQVSTAVLDSELEDMATSVKALSWALHFAELGTPVLDQNLRGSLLAIGEARDRNLALSRPRCHCPAAPTAAQLAAAGAEEEPRLVLELAECLVVHKPPGWEVDCQDAGSGLWLSEFLQRHFPVDVAPLVHCAEHQFGMLHRLDRVSSGLVLIGKTFRGFYDLCWQLDTARLEREYVVLVHGWVPPSLRLIDAKVLHVHAEGQRESRVSEQGKPSRTRVTTVGHFVTRFEQERVSLVVIQIQTGRRHQIRAHMQHVGHPTVADGKYGCREQFFRDKTWCRRNFLHRYRLGFVEVLGRAHEALAPMPADLLAAMGNLVPLDALSAMAYDEWFSSATPRAWALHEGLRENG